MAMSVRLRPDAATQRDTQSQCPTLPSLPANSVASCCDTRCSSVPTTGYTIADLHSGRGKTAEPEERGSHPETETLSAES
jgi:hypothetical protein